MELDGRGHLVHWIRLEYAAAWFARHRGLVLQVQEHVRQQLLKRVLPDIRHMFVAGR